MELPGLITTAGDTFTVDNLHGTYDMTTALGESLHAQMEDNLRQWSRGIGDAIMPTDCYPTVSYTTSGWILEPCRDDDCKKAQLFKELKID